VVKTRIQLDSVKYNSGFVGTFKTIVAEEGSGALLTGLGATAAGYFVQGWFKFGGVEFFKINIANAVGERSAWENRTPIYLASSACAEFIADLFLCPLEAVRIRSVSDKTFPQSLGGGFSKILSTEGVGGLYAGLGPMLFKQVRFCCVVWVFIRDCAMVWFGFGPKRNDLLRASVLLVVLSKPIRD
jgi:solute carrier family 25 phosphate transporter 3